MGVTLRKVDEDKFGIFQTTDGIFLDWEYLMLDKNKVSKYIQENPFPKDSRYSQEDFEWDLQASGSIVIGCEKEETAQYIADMLYELI